MVCFIAVKAVSADGHHHTGTDIASVRATLNTTLTAAASVVQQSNTSVANLADVVQKAVAALTGILSEVITTLRSVYNVVDQQGSQFQAPTSVTDPTQIQAFAEKLSASVIGAVTIIQNVAGDEVAQVATVANAVMSSYERLILAGFEVNSDVSVSTISTFSAAISGTFFATSGTIKAVLNTLTSAAAGNASAAIIEAVNGLAVVLTTILQAIVAGASKVAGLNTGLTNKPVLEKLTILIARAKDALGGVTAIVHQLSGSISSNGNVLDVSFLATALKKINASFSANHHSF